jgi:threonine/homoserine/homoserine lactone efflux protein
MDLGILIAVAMLAVWGIATVFFEAPGWVHLLLTFGVFLLVWRIVAKNAAPKKENP